MIIDVHGHYTTAPAALWSFRAAQIAALGRPVKAALRITDDEIARSLAGHFRQMEDVGIDRLLFSPQGSAMGHHFGSELVSRLWTEACNDLIARACELFPGSLVPVCALPQSPGAGIDGSVAELERCVREKGFVGCNINPDVAGGGQPFTPRLGDEYWYPLYATMVELDVPGMIHASAAVDPARHLNGSHYLMIDELAVFELCYSNVFKDFPTLKLIVPHGGGAAPYQWSRYRALFVQGGRDRFDEVAKHLYFDTAVYDPESVELLIRKAGPKNVLFGSEMFGTAKDIDPETGETFDSPVASFVKAIPWLSAEDKASVFEGNARALFARAKF